MEYVILRAAHPTWMNLQLPTEVAEIIQYHPTELKELRQPSRGVAFLARGPGIVRVVPTFRAREVLPIETVRNRYIAPAHLTEKLLFTIPGPVARHLGIQVQARGPHDARATDDSVMWFLPAPEYYQFRTDSRTERGWTGPRPAGYAHVYLAKSLIPLTRDLSDLESRIEQEEWRPRLEALERVVRPRGRAG
ncbi:MAG TPA: hypothetical protein VFF67_05675 [Thermoplasmata archaeon]|nr:hypothetical protein [Thermoplasmata archaeon]